ncbi:hypothetical protein GCM10009111_13120 [Colwellia asteriadis]|uniref:Type II secretion system protein n=1 Tax=Colwellia asteriadis TaxID=517723 RepID=A0ABN1L5M2_9GAMM
MIELLIVLVLIGLSSSIVMPAMWQQLEQTQYRAEIAKLKSLSSYCRHYAYFKGATLEVTVENNLFTVSDLSSGDTLRQLEFNNLIFEKQTFAFDSKATFDNNVLSITKKNGGQVIELSI